MLLLVCSWRHGGHAGLQEQNCISSMGTKLFFHANSVKKIILFCHPTWQLCHMVANQEQWFFFGFSTSQHKVNVNFNSLFDVWRRCSLIHMPNPYGWRSVLFLVLCNSPKKYLVLIICLGKKRVYFTQSLEEKRDTCTSATVRKNLHLDQEWCPDLYWSLVLCNSPKKNLC